MVVPPFGSSGCTSASPSWQLFPRLPQGSRSSIRSQEPIRWPIARTVVAAGGAARVKGGAAAEPGEGTLDAREHSRQHRGGDGGPHRIRPCRSRRWLTWWTRLQRKPGGWLPVRARTTGCGGARNSDG